MKKKVDDVLARAEKLARVYIDALAMAEGATGYAMSRSSDMTLDGLLGVQPSAASNDEPLLRVESVLAAILTARAIAVHADLAGRLHRGEDVVATIETIHQEWVDPVADVLTRCATPKGKRKTILAQDGSEKAHAPNRGNASIHEALACGHPVVGISTDPKRHLPSALLRTAQYRLVLPMLDEWTLSLLLEAITGQKYAGEIDGSIVRSCDLGDLSLAIRRDCAPAKCLDRLRDLVTDKTSYLGDGPLLEELHGYGEAAAWGLELIEDMTEYKAGRLKWGDVANRSLLLSSDPGLGKTSFAAALSRSIGAHLVATSVADWNAAAHLGGTLQAMRSAFAEARRHRPSVLLIDEFEGISSRQSLSGDYIEYWTQIVNLLLELLSNTSDLEGVIVVATTNHAEKIDFALLRSGRIDRRIHLEKPNHEDLSKIFRYCIGPDYLPGVDMMSLALAAAGSTGADVTKWVMRAKARARRQGASLAIEHILFEIRGDAPTMAPIVRWRVAIHEAGHGVVARHLKLGAVKSMAIVPTGGTTEMAFSPDIDMNEADMADTLAFFLAGRAAEELVFGFAGAGGGGTGGESDLERATNLAVKAETAFGFGKTLGLVNMRVEHPNTLVRMPDVLTAVKLRLDGALTMATGILTQRRLELEKLARELDCAGYLRGSDIDLLLADRALKTQSIA